MSGGAASWRILPIATWHIVIASLAERDQFIQRQARETFSMVSRLNLERRRWVGLMALVLTASALIPAALALACNPQAYLTIGQSQYAPGGSARVSGTFFKSNVNITVSLDRTGQSTTVTTSGNGAFQTTFALPAGAPTGGYTVTAIGFEANGDVTAGLPARGSFSVAAAQAAAEPSPASGEAQAPAQASAPAAQAAPAPQSSQSAAKPAEQPAAAPAAARPPAARPASGYREPSVTREPDVQTSSGSPKSQRATTARSTTTTTADRGTSRTTATPSTGAAATGRPVFGGSIAPTVSAPASPVTTAAAPSVRAPGTQGARTDKSARSGGSRSSTSRVTPQAAEQTAADDVWGSVSSGRTPSVMPVAGDGATVSSSRSGTNLVLGLLLLGAGAALVGGLAAATARQRVRVR